nr:DUF4996 domain-containing protein [Aurantibacter crassamenti]
MPEYLNFLTNYARRLSKLLNGGHDDEKAAININIYQWYIDNNVDIIQTDRPELLINFLRSKGLHN